MRKMIYTILLLFIVSQQTIYAMFDEKPMFTHIPKSVVLPALYYNLNITSSFYPGGDQDSDGNVSKKLYHIQAMDIQVGLPFRLQAGLQIVGLDYKLFSGAFRWNVLRETRYFPSISVGGISLAAEYGERQEIKDGEETITVPQLNSFGYPVLYGESENSFFFVSSKTLTFLGNMQIHLGWGNQQFQAQGGLAAKAHGLFFGIEKRFEKLYLITEFDGVKSYIGFGWIPSKDFSLSFEIRAPEDLPNSFNIENWSGEMRFADGVSGFTFALQFSSFFNTAAQKKNYESIYPIEQKYRAELRKLKEDAKKIEEKEFVKIEEVQSQLDAARNEHRKRLQAIKARESKLWEDFYKQKTWLENKKSLIKGSIKGAE